jgi:D-alanine-D-alanine ligase
MILNFKIALQKSKKLLNSCIESLDVVLVAHVLSPRGWDNPLQRNCSETEQFTPEEFNGIYRGIVSAGFFIRKVFFSELDFIKDLVEKVDEYSSTIVFNLCRNGSGMNKKTVVPAICDLLEISFTSSDAGPCVFARDKMLHISFLSSKGIPCPATGRLAEELHGLISLDAKVICKPIAGSASQGVDENSIMTLKEASSICDEDMLIQEYIDGYECEVPIFCSDGQCFAVPPVGLSFGEKASAGILTYENSKISNYSLYSLNEVLPADICNKIMADAEKAFNYLALNTYGRVDFRIDKETHQHYLIDISTTPYITPHSSFAFTAEKNGKKYSDIFRLIISAALQRKNLG